MKPILFNTEMVSAILAGKKTQTRRIVKGYLRENVEIDTPEESEEFEDENV